MSEHHDELRCLAPMGSGRELSVSVVVGGQSSLPPHPIFSYDEPRIGPPTSAVPAVEDAMHRKLIVQGTSLGSPAPIAGELLILWNGRQLPVEDLSLH